MAKVCVNGFIGTIENNNQGWWFQICSRYTYVPNDAVAGAEDLGVISSNALGYVSYGDFPYTKTYSDLLKVLAILQKGSLCFFVTKARALYFIKLLGLNQDYKKLCQAIEKQGIFSENMLDLVTPLTPEQSDWCDIHFLKYGFITSEVFRQWVLVNPGTKVMLGNRLYASGTYSTGITLSEARDFIKEARTEKQWDWVKRNILHEKVLAEIEQAARSA
jgi:hypothetical protein